VLSNILIRSKYSLPQAKIQNTDLRSENIKDSFQINLNFKENLENKNIIIVDDICTSGSTINEASEALKTLNPNKIIGLVIAKD